MWAWRNGEKIGWTEHKTNEEVLKKIGEIRTLIHTIRTRQRKWIRYTLRRDPLQGVSK